MKICPKCRFLDLEEFGPHDACPQCGVIYAQAEATTRDEKFWRNRERKTAKEYFTKKREFEKQQEKIQKEKFKAKNKKKWSLEKIPFDELRPGWTWDELKNGPKKRKWNFWLWVAMIAAAALVSGVNIYKIFN